MSMFFKNVHIFPNQTITLVNDLTNTTYPIICAAIYSKPDVSLTLYDTNTLAPLSTNSNSINSKQCQATNVCTNILQVNFRFTNNLFDHMTSVSCSTNSLNPTVPLFSSITINTTVISNHLCLINSLLFLINVYTFF